MLLNYRYLLQSSGFLARRKTFVIYNQLFEVCARGIRRSDYDVTVEFISSKNKYITRSDKISFFRYDISFYLNQNRVCRAKKMSYNNRYDFTVGDKHFLDAHTNHGELYGFQDASFAMGYPVNSPGDWVICFKDQNPVEFEPLVCIAVSYWAQQVGG
jgi:hypothetical protein